MFAFFSFFILAFLVLLSVLLLFAWSGTKDKVYAKIVAYFWLGLFILFILGQITHWFTAKKELQKDDYYGEYIIDRNYFSGKQADWQYESFRFEIKENDSIYFYVTDKEKILKTFPGRISTVKPWSSERLKIKMKQPTHHIMASDPTIFRSAWSFHLVFYSPKFYNVYFKKGKWKPIEK
ncbi:MAG: hypothetical protein JNL24_02710 [Bacteroidia bacterium]|nr:hypothetical protein [Bacteroidia bacterium]